MPYTSPLELINGYEDNSIHPLGFSLSGYGTIDLHVFFSFIALTVGHHGQTSFIF